MERLVKERLVGAAVLLAAAVILIPEMLSGPKHEETAQSSVSAGDAPTKTYTIDLGQPAQPESPPQASAQLETTLAPPAESAPPATAAQAQAPPESSVQETASKRAEAPAVTSKPPPQPSFEMPKPAAAVTPPKHNSVEPAATDAKPQAVVSERSVPTSKGWAVQLGSFSKADTAERLAQQVRSRGHNAFVMPVKSGNGTLYRVRVGPMQDRAAADALQRQLKGEFSGAAVVAHP